MIEQINQIDLELILNELWIKYKKQWGSASLYENWKLTDWWKADLNKWIVSDFSNWWRASWDRVKFVQTTLWLSFNSTLEWFTERFNIKKEKVMENIKWRELIKEKRDKLPSLSQEQIDYLKGRQIFKYDYCKNNNWNICLPIRSWWGNITSLQSRSIDEKAKSRYYVEANSESDWIFMEELNPKTKWLIVVEWFTDFLSLRQYTSNVVGLVNAKNDWQLRSIKELSSIYEIYFIPDNDEAGQVTVEKLKALGVKFNLFKLNEYWVKDINELLINYWIGKEILRSITDESEKPLSNLSLAMKKAITNRDLWAREIWDKTFDIATWGITPWSLMIINGFTWEWKTTTMDWIIKKLTEVHNKKVAYCSMDDDVWKMLAMFLWRKFNKDWKTIIYPKVEHFVKEYWIEKFNNFLLYDDKTTLSDFEELVKEEKIDVLIIDYIQIIQGLPWGDIKMQMIAASKKLQRIAKEQHCAVICLSQASMWEVAKPVLLRNPNESFMIRATADTFINVWVYEWTHKIWFVKNKYWSTKYKFTEHETSWDEESWDIIIFDDSSSWASYNWKPKSFKKI